MTMVANPEPTLFQTESLHNAAAKQHGQKSFAGASSNGMGMGIRTPEQQALAVAAAAAAPPSGWQQGEAVVLTRLGLYHPLEKYSHATFPKNQLDLVLQTLQTAFKALSLQVVYGNSPVTARCTSLEQVSFVVSLWNQPSAAGSGNNSSNNSNNNMMMMANNSQNTTVVWEIQRRAGDSMVFCKYAKQLAAVVQAAVSQDVDTVPTVSTTGTAATAIAECVVSMPTLQQAEKLLQHALHNKDNSSNNNSSNMQWEDPHTVHVQALEIADHLLSKDRHDAVVLGLESLSLLSDPAKTSLEGAAWTARAVLVGATPTICTTDNSAAGASAGAVDPAVYQRIQQAVLTTIATGCAQSPGLVEINSSSNMKYYLALLIVANSVSVLSLQQPSSPDNAVVLQRFVQTFYSSGTDLCRGLLGQVHAADQQPHFAYLATRILHGLCRSLPGVRGTMKSQSCVAVVQHAHEVGAVTHAALENESERLLASLQA